MYALNIFEKKNQTNFIHLFSLMRFFLEKGISLCILSEFLVRRFYLSWFLSFCFALVQIKLS